MFDNLKMFDGDFAEFINGHFSAPKIMEFGIFSTSANLVEIREIWLNFSEFWSNFSELTIFRISNEGLN